MINKTINGYTIKRLIGSGGMAEVYYAENSLGLPAAVKVLKREYSLNSQITDRLMNEAKIMKSLHHPHIRKVMDMGRLDEQPCIIMEYLEGGTLKEVMGSYKKVNDASLQKYFDQCAQALIYTHSKGITHRDIKPSNIFITKEGVVKLVDFGIAKSELSISHTITGQTLGTVIYMSPEQVVDPKRVTGKTDIYSLGVTFYHALLGKSPYDATTGSEFAIMRKIVDEDLDLDLVPLKWRNNLAGCLNKNPEDRSFPSMKKSNKDETILDTGRTPVETKKISGLELSVEDVIREIADNMVRIPGGTFTMGCTSEQGSDCFDWEKPVHEVTLSEFSMNKYEVTQGQWTAIMGSNPSGFKGCNRCPVENVSWNEAEEFISKLNNLTGRKYRLPTEAEWEYAARGGQNFKYSGSNNLGSVAWYDGNSGERTNPVGSKSANGYGLYDMSGNVWEWCSDWFGSYSSGSKTNPRGPSSGSYRVLGGGSWFGSARYCRVSFRGGGSPGYRNYSIGFRLAE